jgi:hypothetical protein
LGRQFHILSKYHKNTFVFSIFLAGLVNSLQYCNPGCYKPESGIFFPSGSFMMNILKNIPDSIINNPD